MGAIEIQVFVSLVVILGAAFVALICDFLKGSNEQLREANIVMRVREDERDKRDDLVEKVQQQTIEVVAKVQGALVGRPVAAPQAAARAQQPPVAAQPPAMAPAPAAMVTPVADARELFERAQQERSSRSRRGNRRAEPKPPAAPPSESVASWAQDIVIRKHQEVEPAKAPVAEPAPAAAIPAPVAPPLPVPMPAAAARLQRQEFAAHETPAAPAAVTPAATQVPMAEAAALPLAPVQTAAAPAIPAYSNLSAAPAEEVVARTEPARQEATPPLIQDQQPLAAQPVATISGIATPAVETAAPSAEPSVPRAVAASPVCQLGEAGSVAGPAGVPVAAAAAPVTVEFAALTAEADSSLPVSALRSEVPVFEIVPPAVETVEEAVPVADIVAAAEPLAEAVETVEPMVAEAAPMAGAVETVEPMVAEAAPMAEAVETVEPMVAEAAPIAEVVETVEPMVAEAAPMAEVVETVEPMVAEAAPMAEAVETVEPMMAEAAPMAEAVETVEPMVGEAAPMVEAVETVEPMVAEAAPVAEAVETVEPMMAEAPVEEIVEAVAAAPMPDYSLLEDTPVYAEIPTLPRVAEPEPEPVAEPVAEAEPLFAPTLVDGAPEEEVQVVRIRVITDDDLMPVSEFTDTPVSFDEIAAFEPAPVAEPEPVMAAEPEPVVAAEPEPEPVPSWEEVIAAMAAEAQPESEPVVEAVAPDVPELAAEVLPEPMVEAVASVEPEPVADLLPEPVAAAEAPVADAADEPSIWLPGAEPVTWNLQPAPAVEAPAPAAEPEPVLAEAASLSLPVSDDPFSFRPAVPQPVAETPAPAMPRGELRSKVVEMRAAAQARTEQELPAVPTLELPGGFHEPNALARLLEDETPFAGLVIAVSVVDYVRLMADQGKPAIEQIMASVTRLVMSLTREQDFACRIAEDEFILIFARETGGAAKRRIQLVSERLWDYQLRSLGSVSIIFSWGASESQMQPIVHAVENAREQMLETRRNRRNLTGVSRRFGRHAANS